jgi:hypothetical protein
MDIYTFVLVLKSKWNEVTEDPAQSPVIIVADEMLVHLEIIDALLLVHYTIPLVQYKFNYRMSSVMGSVPNKFKAAEVSLSKHIM